MELAKGKELLGGLVDTQAECYGDRELLGQLASGALIAQSRRCAVHKETVAELSSRERKWLRAAAIGPGTSKAVLTGRSAARMLGMWVVAATPEHVELTLPSGFSQPKAERAEGTKFYRGKLEHTEIFHYPELPGIEFTGPVRTAFDIAIRHGFAKGLVAFDWLLASRGATRAELKQAVALMRGKKGVAVLREVLRYAVHNSQSPFESYARALLIQAGMTEVATQVPVGPYSGDLGLGKLIIEVDGEEKYDGKTYAPLDITLRKERKREVYLQNRESPCAGSIRWCCCAIRTGSSRWSVRRCPIWPDSIMRCALCDLEKPRSRVSENQHRIVDTGKPLTSP